MCNYQNIYQRPWDPSQYRYTVLPVKFSIMKIIHDRRIFVMENHIAWKAALQELHGSKVIWHFVSADSGLLRPRDILTRIIIKANFVWRLQKQLAMSDVILTKINFKSKVKQCASEIKIQFMLWKAITDQWFNVGILLFRFHNSLLLRF